MIREHVNGFGSRPVLIGLSWGCGEALRSCSEGSYCGDATAQFGNATAHCGDATAHIGDATAHIGDATAQCGDAFAHWRDTTAHCRVRIARVFRAISLSNLGVGTLPDGCDSGTKNVPVL